MYLRLFMNSVCFSFSPNMEGRVVKTKLLDGVSQWLLLGSENSLFFLGVASLLKLLFYPFTPGLAISALPDDRHVCCLKPGPKRGDPVCFTLVLQPVTLLVFRDPSCIHYLRTALDQLPSLWEFFFCGCLGLWLPSLHSHIFSFMKGFLIVSGGLGVLLAFFFLITSFRIYTLL